jgi:hypothetical protein
MKSFMCRLSEHSAAAVDKKEAAYEKELTTLPTGAAHCAILFLSDVPWTQVLTAAFMDVPARPSIWAACMTSMTHMAVEALYMVALGSWTTPAAQQSIRFPPDVGQQ